MVTQSTRKQLTSPDWDEFLKIADVIALDQIQAQAAVKAVRGCLKSAKFSSSGAFPPQTPYYTLCLIGVLVRNAWFFLHHFHESDIIEKILVRKLQKSTTHPGLREKAISLLRTWSEYYRTSTAFPRFFVLYQSAAASAAHPDLIPRVEPFAEPFAPTEVIGSSGMPSFVLPSAAHLPPFPTDPELPEITATRSYRIQALIEGRLSKFHLLEQLVTILDPPDLETNDTLIELYPRCKGYHVDTLRWIDEGQIAEDLMIRLLELNDQMVKILDLYNRLAQGLTNAYPCSSSSDFPATSQPHADYPLTDFDCSDSDGQSLSSKPLIRFPTSSSTPAKVAATKSTAPGPGPTTRSNIQVIGQNLEDPDFSQSEASQSDASYMALIKH